MDGSGNIYVVEYQNNRVHKFNSSGGYLLKWGSSGSGNGQFSSPEGIVVDSAGNVYVTDTGNNRIQKFSSTGTYLAQWGSFGTTDSQFRSPGGIAIDSSDNIYVADKYNDRIQKFTSEGTFLLKWGTSGSGNGQLDDPAALAFDSLGNIYVAEIGNNRIQKLTPSGTYIAKWGSLGSGNGQFNWPWGIAIGAFDTVFVAEYGNSRVQKFQADGTYLTQFGNKAEGGEFNSPRRAAVSASGNVYVSDLANNRIQMFDASGAFLRAWGWDVVRGGGTGFEICTQAETCKPGESGTGNGQLNFPYGLAFDSAGNVLVAELFNSRIQRFDANGNYLTRWGSSGSGQLQFNQPADVAVDSAGDIYVVENGNNQVQKFNAAGVFLRAWGWDVVSGGGTGFEICTSSDTCKAGLSGSGDGQFNSPSGLTIDAAGNVYIADSGNRRIQKFDNNGNFLAKWGSLGSGDGQFNIPSDISTSVDGDIYVADTGNYRVQKFTDSGVFLAKWGSYGSGIGQFIFPYGVATGGSGAVYVVDSDNHRIQKFVDAAFALDDDGSATYTLAAGSFTMRETAVSGWNLAGLVCNGGNPVVSGSQVTLTVPPGGNITCDYTNAQPGSITVVKEVVGAVPAADWAYSGTLGAFTIDKAGGNKPFTNLTAGSYTINETAVTGYSQSVSCTSGETGGDSVAVSLQPGESVICTFTNTAEPGSIFIIKSVVGQAPTAAWQYNGDLGEFTLPGAGGDQLFYPLEVGTYTINEIAVPGYSQYVECGSGESGTDSVTITIGPGDHRMCTFTNTAYAPVAEDKTVTTDEDTAVDITLTAADANGDPLTYIVVTEPAHGTLSGTAPNLTYTPAANYHGSDSFTFTANDGTADSNVATVSITINATNDAPMAADRTVTTDEDTPVDITLSATDGDGDSLTYAIVESPAHGTLSGDAPNVTYTPDANYHGSDSFTFQAYDGAAYSNIATVHVNLNPVNDPPIANDDTAATDEDTPVTVHVLDNDYDPDDGDTLAVIAVSDPPNGSASIEGLTVVYTPDLDFNTPDGEFDTFTYTISDPQGATATAEVRVTVGAENDPPVAVADEVVTPEDTAVTIAVLDNDSDADHNLDPAGVSVIIGPQHGVAVANADGTITYTPALNYNGPDEFTYEVCDTYPVCAAAQVTLTVTPVNDPPVAVGQNLATGENTSLAVTLVATDVDDDSLVYTIVNAPQHGTLSGSAPNLVYTPAAQYTGADSFTFRANDGKVNSNLATISIEIYKVTTTGTIEVRKVTDPATDTTTTFTFDPSWSTTNFTLKNGQNYVSGPLQPGVYSVSEVSLPTGWSQQSAACVNEGGTSQPPSNIPLAAGDKWVCTFTNKQSTTPPPTGTCPAEAGNLLTKVFGVGMGSQTNGVLSRVMILSNPKQLVSIYALMAGSAHGTPTQVRFDALGQVLTLTTPTSPAYRDYAVYWFGGDLRPSNYVQVNVTDNRIGGYRTPRALVLFPTYRTTKTYVNVFRVFNNSATNFAYYEWIPTQTQVVPLPAPRTNVNLTVTVAVVDNQKDNKPLVVTVSAGGVSKTVTVTSPNKGNELNLITFALKNVPAGTTEMRVTLTSPARTGDSGAIVGLAANYTCKP